LPKLTLSNRPKAPIEHFKALKPQRKRFRGEGKEPGSGACASSLLPEGKKQRKKEKNEKKTKPLKLGSESRKVN